MQLTTEDYYAELLALRPPGPAWSPDDQDLRVAADGLARIHDRALDLLEEADPGTTAEMLAAWERNVGLPDQCEAIADTPDGRRARLVQKLVSRGGQSRAYFLAIAAAFNRPEATIREWSPFVGGVSRGGDPRWRAGSHVWRFFWRMYVGPAPITWFRGGTGRAGQDSHARFSRDLALECVIRRLKPGHTQVAFLYSRGLPTVRSATYAAPA